MRISYHVSPIISEFSCLLVYDFCWSVIINQDSYELLLSFSTRVSQHEEISRIYTREMIVNNGIVRGCIQTVDIRTSRMVSDGHSTVKRKEQVDNLWSIGLVINRTTGTPSRGTPKATSPTSLSSR